MFTKYNSEKLRGLADELSAWPNDATARLASILADQAEADVEASGPAPIPKDDAAKARIAKAVKDAEAAAEAARSAAMAAADQADAANSWLEEAKAALAAVTAEPVKAEVAAPAQAVPAAAEVAVPAN
jgi:hypothetical protein